LGKTARKPYFCEKIMNKMMRIALVLSFFICLLPMFANAQKLEYWIIPSQNLIFEEHLTGRNMDYATITVSIRYRGDIKRSFQLVRQKAIKSPSPQDCQVISVAADSLVVSKGNNQDIMTYRIKRGLDTKYLRPMYEPLQYWKITELK
jgi:hypothetical protein